LITCCFPAPISFERHRHIPSFIGTECWSSLLYWQCCLQSLHLHHLSSVRLSCAASMPMPVSTTVAGLAGRDRFTSVPMAQQTWPNVPKSAVAHPGHPASTPLRAVPTAASQGFRIQLASVNSERRWLKRSSTTNDGN